MTTASNLYPQYPAGSPPPPPMTASTSYNAGYETNFLQPQTSAPYNPGSSYSSPPPPQVLPSTPGLPPIPAPSRLQQFGNLSLTGINPNPPAMQTSYAAPAYGQASTSQGMTHSVFPLAQTGTYANYTYNPQTVQPESGGIPWWVWALVCLLLIGGAVGGVWYYLRHRAHSAPILGQTVVQQGVKGAQSLQPIGRTVSETVTTVQNRYGTAQTKNSVESVDEDHHSHLRHVVSGWVA